MECPSEVARHDSSTHIAAPAHIAALRGGTAPQHMAGFVQRERGIQSQCSVAKETVGRGRDPMALVLVVVSITRMGTEVPSDGQPCHRQGANIWDFE